MESGVDALDLGQVDLDQADSGQGDSSRGERTGQVRIEFTLTESMNYASWQNSVPLLRGLSIHNETDETLNDLRLELRTVPGLTRPKEWVIDRIAPGGSIGIVDRDVTLDPGYLLGLNEAERAVAILRLSRSGQVLAEGQGEIRVLARDEWGGMGSMSELLAAFVMPNDQALASLLKSVGEILVEHGHAGSLDGYQSRDPRRAYMLTAAIWSAVAAKALTYANPPRSFEQVGQKTRRPAIVLADGLATCLDSTLLFAAAIEAVGLNPVIVLTRGHSFVGAWLVEKTFPRLVETDCGELRKAIGGKELITFETTLVTHRPPGRFEDAVRTAALATRESEESDFVAVLDIARARMAQIRPLASHDPTRGDDNEASTPSGPLPLPALPDLGSIPPEISEELPTSAEGRIDRWQRKLLDLSLRNRLLNFRASLQSIPFLCPDLETLESRLSGGARLRMISLPEENPIGDRDVELHRRKNHEDLNIQFACQALDRSELPCLIRESELTGRLTTLFRKTRNDLAEGGSNTLFLAFGFLKWKRTGDDKTSYRAPLLLVPVKLLRKSVLSAFRLERHEDDIRFNATLIQLLKKDFGKDLSRIESTLSDKGAPVRLQAVLEQVRREVRDIPGFEVIEEVALSSFSFAKYLMWKDLVDRLDQLESNRLVRHLVRDPDKPFRSDDGEIPKPEQLDTRYRPQDIVHPLPGDSSQLAAVMAASEGRDFVLVGPPGTGKSQTITNMIAQCLANKKTVLFVAEKTAALDVVYRRLKAIGLANCCLELHSNKAERRRFLDQLDLSWQHNRRRTPNEWMKVSERLQVRRDELNAYVAAIHQTHPNGWTAFQAYGISVQGHGQTAPRLEWPTTVTHDEATYETLSGIVRELASTFRALDTQASLPMVRATRWSAAWEANLMADTERLRGATESLRSAMINFYHQLGIANKSDGCQSSVDRLRQLADDLLASAGESTAILYAKHFDKLRQTVGSLRSAISDYRRARGLAAADYEPSLDQIPVDEIDQHWRSSLAKFWPMSWLGRRKVTRWLQTYAVSGSADPSTDLSSIRAMREKREIIAKHPLAGQTDHWQDHRTDIDDLQIHLKRAGDLRRAILAVAQPLSAVPQVSRALSPAIRGSSGDMPIYQAATRFLQTYEEWQKHFTAFGATAGEVPVATECQEMLAETSAAMDRLLACRTQLQRWTAWCEVCQRADVAGLMPVVQELETGLIPPDQLEERFRLAYARWWLPGVIDRSDILRSFQQFRQEEAIVDFQRLDELARDIASSRVRDAVAHQLPQPDAVPRRSELGILRHQAGLKRPSKSIREVIESMPDAFGKLAPCLLMSPLSIAQYLPAHQPPFDVVIFDEASQITTWDAIGAIARGRQTIIVGDPKQLPPTNFFGREESDDGDDEIADHEKDLESILDEAKASGVPVLQLDWHYRSRHESLIAFSNWHYYGNQLVTFPAAESIDRGVSLVHLPEAVYDRGSNRSRTNPIEAKAIVNDAVARMKRCLELPEPERPTFGVVTFNSQQQSLIQDLFDQAQRDTPELDWYFSDDRIEPTVVKNLENVQGDERDVMFFSITFGPDASGRVPLTFGALNRDGGERRLNVAVTRARQELVVYTSFLADQLNAEGTKSLGVRHLKHFLDYAQRGPDALHTQTRVIGGGYDSPFEEAVANALIAMGWQVASQVGVSAFRVDLGIVHPDKPGAYLAGVECDGATYHRSAVARDRDKTRQQVLEQLGWNIIRVWSPDWWYDADAAIRSVDERLQELLACDRGPVETMTAAIDEEPSAVCEPGLPVQVCETACGPPSDRVAEPQVFYQRIKIVTDDLDQDRFFDPSYTQTLRTFTQTVLAKEAPVRDDVLVRRVARSHGFARVGSRIRKRILDVVKGVPITVESSGRFLWATEEPRDVIEFRHPEGGTEARGVEEISIAELRGLIRSEARLRETEDVVAAIGKALGIGRLTRSARSRIEEALSDFS